MKILKHGDLKPRKFTCRYCSCEFVANAKEYDGFEGWIYMYCPDCDTKTFDSEPWDDMELMDNGKKNKIKCKDCSVAVKDFFKCAPGEYVCIGVPEPFVIKDINVECTEY